MGKKVEIEIKENPSMKDALEASIAWFDAESDLERNTSFQDRMDLCKYSEWSARKSMGQDVGEYEGVPRIILTHT